MKKNSVFSNRPWLNFYNKMGIPETLEPYPEIPLHQLIDDIAGKFPNSRAIIYNGMEMTFKQVKEDSERLASGLSGLGIKKGDVVTILLPTSAQFAISIWGISRTGATQLWASTMLKEKELIMQLNQTGSNTIITLASNLDMINSIKNRTKLKNIIITFLNDYPGGEGKAIDDKHGVLYLENILLNNTPSPPAIDIDPKNDCVLIRFTGGATGIPKGVMTSHYNLTSNARQVLGILPIVEAVKGKNLTTIQPILMFHLGGFVYIYMTAMGLSQILISNNRDFDTIIDALNRYHPFMCTLVPAQWMEVTAHKNLKHIPLFGLSGAAPLPREIIKEIETEKGGIVTDAYGQSEANCVVTVNLSIITMLLPGGDKSLSWVRHSMPILKRMLPIAIKIAQARAGSVLIKIIKPVIAASFKRFIKRRAKSDFSSGFKDGCGTPVPDTDVKILDVETGKEVGIGETGELYYRGPQLMMGYWPKPGNGLTKDGYLGSGDLAVMDKEGFFSIVDRTKDMINVSGFKVYTKILDETLCKHPSVYAAGCVGVTNPQRPGNEIVKAFIQLNKGVVPNDYLEEELTALVEKELSPYYKPKSYIFLDELPLSDVDKVNKLALREITKSPVD